MWIKHYRDVIGVRKVEWCATSCPPWRHMMALGFQHLRADTLRGRRAAYFPRRTWTVRLDRDELLARRPCPAPRKGQRLLPGFPRCDTGDTK